MSILIFFCNILKNIAYNIIKNVIMEQEEVDVIYSMTINIHENTWFGKRENPRERDEVQEWVAKQLACIEVYTIPCGMSWGVLTTKDEFHKYWDEHSKISNL